MKNITGVFVIKNTETGNYLQWNRWVNLPDDLVFGDVKGAMHVPYKNIAQEMIDQLFESYSVNGLVAEGPIALESDITQNHLVNINYDILEYEVEKYSKIVDSFRIRHAKVGETMSMEKMNKFIFLRGVEVLVRSNEMQNIFSTFVDNYSDSDPLKYSNKWIDFIFSNGLKAYEKELHAVEKLVKLGIDNTTDMEDDFFFWLIHCAEPLLDEIYNLHQRSKRLGLTIDINNYIAEIYTVGTLDKAFNKLRNKAYMNSNDNAKKLFYYKLMKKGVDFFRQHLDIDENNPNMDFRRMKYEMVGSE